MKSVIWFHPLVNSVHLPWPYDAVHVPWNEDIHVGIHHDQVSEHPRVETAQESGINGVRTITDPIR